MHLPKSVQLALFTSIAAVLWSLRLLGAPTDTVSTVLSVLIMGGAARLFYPEYKRSGDLFHPGVAFPIVFLFLYSMGSGYLAFLGDLYASDVISYAAIALLSYQIGVFAVLPNRREQVVEGPFHVDVDTNILSALTLVMLAVSLVASTFIYSRIGVPLLSEDLVRIRVEGFREVSHYSLFLLRNVGLVFLLVGATYYGHRYGRKNFLFRHRVLVFSLLTLSFLLMLSTAGRADLIFVIMLAILGHHYLRRRIALREAVILTTLLIVGGALYNFLRLFRSGGQHETLAFLTELLGDSLLLQFGYHVFAQTSLVGVTFRDVIHHIPSTLPHFNGTLIPTTMSTLFPGHQSPPGEILKKAAGLDFTGGQANLTLVGDFYADFGLPGVVGGMFFLGVSIALLYRRLCRYRTSSWLILYVYSTYALIVGIPGGLFSQAIRYYYLLILIVVLWLARLPLLIRIPRSDSGRMAG